MTQLRWTNKPTERIAEEFEQSKAHYEQLGVGDRLGWGLPARGHEIHYEEGLAFLRQWL